MQQEKKQRNKKKPYAQFIIKTVIIIIIYKELGVNAIYADKTIFDLDLSVQLIITIRALQMTK